jgi:hypothetical protein
LRQNEAMCHQRGSTSWTNNRNSTSRKSESYLAEGVRYVHYILAKSSTLRLKGEALELLFSLLISARQRTRDFLVGVLVLPARHAQAGLGDQVGVDPRTVVTEKPE